MKKYRISLAKRRFGFPASRGVTREAATAQEAWDNLLQEENDDPRNSEIELEWIREILELDGVVIRKLGPPEPIVSKKRG